MGHRLIYQNMKNTFVSMLFSVAAASLLTGCIGLQFGGGEKRDVVKSATTGQQLLDLKVAKDNGAITEAEYQIQKNKVLGK